MVLFGGPTVLGLMTLHAVVGEFYEETLALVMCLRSEAQICEAESSSQHIMAEYHLIIACLFSLVILEMISK